MNTPIPAGMAITDNRAEYENKEMLKRLLMPKRTYDLASLNRKFRYEKGYKFQLELKIKRAVRERRAIIAKAKALGVTAEDLL